ncbi:Asp domain-containing protein, partial [Cephalotus follicularis]
TASFSPNALQAPIVPGSGEYLLNVSLGTPPVDILAIADTGSDLIWTQCKPCDDCFKQDLPLFDTKSSSTYRDLSCNSNACQSLQGTSCDGSSCQYLVQYGDQSSSSGNLALETLTLGSTTGKPVAVPKTVFGCGHDNGGAFNEKTTGIIGLGGGQVSLISQLSMSINGKFSYCLVPLTSTSSNDSSTINFGANAVVSGHGAVSTPYVSKDTATFYYLTLKAISVGTKRIENGDSSALPAEGNIIIDSGTTLTLLPSDFYSKVESAVSDAIDASPIDDPSGQLSLCYEATSNLKVPIITMHFSGADVTLKPVNTFVLVSEGVVCFTFIANDQIAIYGNLSQMNFLIGYDTVQNTVSFKPTDC